MDEYRFDELLEGPPPDDVARDVTPWRRAMGQVLTGIALQAVTFDFWYIGYFQLLLSHILLILGHRTLRKENPWFFGGFLVSIYSCVYFLAYEVIQTTIFHRQIFAQDWWIALNVITNVCKFLQCLFLWMGLRQIRTKAGLTPGFPGGAGLFIWYIVLMIMALYKVTSIVLTISMLVCFFFVLRNLHRVTQELDEVGYAVTPHCIRIPEWAITVSIIGTLILGGFFGYTQYRQYPMQWQPYKPSVTGQTEQVKAELTQMGFPANVLEDMTQEDILACQGAILVRAATKDHPANLGRHAVKIDENGNNIYTTVFDVKELRITNIAVLLPGEQPQWRFIHHFQWVQDPGFYGTEALCFTPIYEISEDYSPVGSVTGQLLMDKDGDTYSATYHTLSSKKISNFFGTEESIFAAFSLSEDGTNHRGYVAYAMQNNGDINRGVNPYFYYNHQVNWLQYPVKTAEELVGPVFYISSIPCFASISTSFYVSYTELPWNLDG